jgi:hypothetical protein
LVELFTEEGEEEQETEEEPDIIEMSRSISNCTGVKVKSYYGVQCLWDMALK